ncbi:phenylalanine--tRNA ligase subunit beta [Candidatus Micrarchaeota archaeon]|nr:phenylalanine--tRNA ligase subunit beta [Candidatus Micrarchaeota archaeon]
MPTIELDKRLLLEHAGRKLPDATLRERIPMIGTFLEGVDQKRVRVEVFVNRPDMLSEEGFGRSLSSFLGIRTGLCEYRALKSSYECIVDPSVKSTDRPLTALAVLKGLRFDATSLESAIQLQEKLAVTHGRKRKKAGMGIYDMSSLSWPLKYTTVPRTARFTPMDLGREVTVGEALKQSQKGREYGHLVERFERLPAFTDATGKILSVLPVTQDASTIVSTKTRDMMVEVSGNDWGTVSKMLNILAANWSERGATIHSVMVRQAGKTLLTPELKTELFRLDVDYCNKLLGLGLSPTEITRLLARMGHKAVANGKRLDVTVPCYRTDILHPIDLVEEVAIAYGYENFVPAPLESHGSGTLSRQSSLERKLAALCTGMGFQEVITLHLSNRKTLLDGVLLPPTRLVETLNSVNSEYDVCRNALTPVLLHLLSENKHHEYPQRVFEIGEVFHPRDPVHEEVRLALVSAHKNAGFSEARSAAEALLLSLGLAPSAKAFSHPTFTAGRCAKLYANDAEVGILGEVHPKVLNNFELEMPITCIEISAERLLRLVG